MNARDLTGAGLIRALGGFRGSAGVTRALAARADQLATAIAAREPGATVTVVPRGAGELTINASAPGLFAREFGSMQGAPEPVIGPAIEDVTRGAP